MSKDHPTVLLVDDDDGVRFTLREVLEELDVTVEEASDGQAAIDRLDEGPVDLVITDLRMPRADGMAVLRHAVDRHPGIKVVMITAHGSESAAVEAMKNGAFDYFPKPFDVDDVARVVTRATETARLVHENRRLRAALHLSQHMIFRSEKMRRIAEVVERVGPKDVTVLIHGESGTGKELVADALVATSTRRDAPFVKFNCAALPREVAEDELFGHSEGAFTGAVRRREGLFGRADGGTLFLDEIAELDLSVQGKLLRTLQAGEVRAVGDDQPRKVDVRIIAATHADLAARVKAGDFREDLFYRLDVVQIALPPLRERPADLEPLIEHFVKRYANRFGLKNARLGPHARARLMAGSYKGNVRELENEVERLVALASDDLIEDLGVDTGAETPLTLKARVDAYERGLILAELERTGWNRSEAARALGVGRVTLLDKLKRYGLSPEE
ncbi:MAG: sigma-54 dependent transcriptional regulator [Deltaproteobacteria bacterium]